MKITELITGKIIALKSKGDSGYIIQQKILDEDDVSVSIRQINHTYQESKKNIQKVDLRGRPSLFSEEQLDKIKKAIQNNRHLTAVDIQRNQRLNPCLASVSTIQKLLNRIGYLARIAPSKPNLTKIHISARYQFAMDLDDWPNEDIQQIIFTDESKMYAQKQGKVFIRCKKGYSIPSRLFEPKEMYHGGMEVIVWGAISFNGPVALIQIDGTLTSEKYIEILKEGIFDNKQLDLKFKVFQHDSCRPHRGLSVKEFLKTKKIEILKWPSKSPDLNIIEPVWGFCKNWLYNKRNQIKSKQDVWKFCQQAFFSKECEELVTNLYLSYKNRITQVLKKEGQNTKY